MTELTQKLCDAYRREIAVQIASIKESFEAYDKSLKYRLDLMNEIREQLKTQREVFATSQYVDGIMSKMQMQIDAINKSIAMLSLKQSEDAGANKWSNHIVTVLIGAAILLGVWVIKGR